MTAFVGGFEGWSLVESIYFGCASTTGVGYGDFAPRTQAGRLYASFLMPISITIMLNAMGELNVLYQMSKLQKEDKLQKIMVQLFKENAAKGSLGGNAEEVTLAEFQLHMVKQMGKVELALLDEIQQFFNAMDIDGDGVLTLEDIAKIQSLKVQSHAAAIFLTWSTQLLLFSKVLITHQNAACILPLAVLLPLRRRYPKTARRRF